MRGRAPVTYETSDPAFADIDGDGDDDFIIHGQSPTGYVYYEQIPSEPVPASPWASVGASIGILIAGWRRLLSGRPSAIAR